MLLASVLMIAVRFGVRDQLMELVGDLELSEMALQPRGLRQAGVQEDHRRPLLGTYELQAAVVVSKLILLVLRMLLPLVEPLDMLLRHRS